MRHLLAAAVTAFSLLSGAAHAQSVDASKPESVAAAMRDKGYRAELTKDDIGDPMIRSATSGYNFVVLFYGCTKGADCDSLQLRVAFDLKDGTTYQRASEWNAEMLTTRAYLDEEMDPVLELYMRTRGGMTRDSFYANLSSFEGAIGKVFDFFQ